MKVKWGAGWGRRKRGNDFMSKAGKMKEVKRKNE